MVPSLDAAERDEVVRRALADLVADLGAAPPPLAELYQDFQLRCRMLGLKDAGVDLQAFRRRLAMARAGIDDREDWSGALALGGTLPDDSLTIFLAIARAAREGAPCPPEADLAALYGTASLGRLRRVLAAMEGQDVIVARTDLVGRRSISIPALGWATAPAEEAPEPATARRR
jgi:hypothetical protein